MNKANRLRDKSSERDHLKLFVADNLVLQEASNIVVSNL